MKFLIELGILHIIIMLKMKYKTISCVANSYSPCQIWIIVMSQAVSKAFGAGLASFEVSKMIFMGAG